MEPGKFSREKIGKGKDEKPGQDVVDRLRELVTAEGKTYSDEFYAGLTLRKANAIIRKFEDAGKEPEPAGPQRPDLPIGELLQGRRREPVATPGRHEPPNALHELPAAPEPERHKIAGPLVISGEDGTEVIIKAANGTAGIVVNGPGGGVSLGVSKGKPVIALMRKGPKGGAEAVLKLTLCPDSGKAAIAVPNGRGGSGHLCLDELLDRLTPHWRHEPEIIPETQE